MKCWNVRTDHFFPDFNSNKNEIDLFYTNDSFLTSEDKLKREHIIFEQEKRGIPDHILEMFKVVSKADKLKVYDNISKLNSEQHKFLINLIQKINYPSHMLIDWDGLQVVFDCISPIVNSQLRIHIETKTNKGEGSHSVLTPQLSDYIKKGFKGLLDYKRTVQGLNIDVAIRDTARFVFNTAKYQLVKYFGVFNVMYKYHRSKTEEISFEEVSGIDRLLTKLEYNALTKKGKQASDYGVPSKVLQFYENSNDEELKNSFDEFERKAFNSVEKVINR